MARRIGSDGEKTSAALRQAALELMALHGYEAMSMRRLAARIGLQAPALYRYFPTKQDLLYALMRDHMEALIAAWVEARPSGKDHVVQLSAFVHNHIRFHVARRHATHVSNLELRSLSHEHLSVIVRLRSAYEKELRQILREGVQAGLFRIDDIGLTAMAVIQMMTGVIVWFRPNERLSIGGVADTYLKMTMRLVGANENGERRHV